MTDKILKYASNNNWINGPFGGAVFLLMVYYTSFLFLK